MKKIYILLILFISHNIVSQEFQNSTKFLLSKTNKSFSLKESEIQEYVDIFLIDKKTNAKIKKINVYWESYENDGFIEELLNPNLTNIDRIIKVNISNCACYCSNVTYFWLVTKNNNWIDLPTIMEDDFELTQTTKNYYFSKNEILLIEEKFKIINYDSGEMKSINKKVLKKYSWNGQIIKEL